MSNPLDPVLYSFGLYVMYLLLPLLPAAVIFKMFPQTKVSVAGPLQHLTFRATGAFAAYVVTAVLGFSLVHYIEQQIDYMRHPVYYGVFVDLAPNQAVQSDRLLLNCTRSAEKDFGWHNCAFAVLLDGPLENADPLRLRYFESQPNEISGMGELAPAGEVMFTLVPPKNYPPRFRMVKEHGVWVIKPESDIQKASTLALR